jgi:Protein of unknown function (DUF2934)
MTSSGSAPADLIRQRAYQLWDSDGRPEGRDLEYWLRAEESLALEGTAGRTNPALGATGLNEPVPDNFDVAAIETGTSAAERVANQPDESAGGDRASYVQQRRTRKKAES